MDFVDAYVALPYSSPNIAVISKVGNVPRIFFILLPHHIERKKCQNSNIVCRNDFSVSTLCSVHCFIERSLSDPKPLSLIASHFNYYKKLLHV